MRGFINVVLLFLVKGTKQQTPAMKSQQSQRSQFVECVVNQALLKRLSPSDALEECVWNGERANPDSMIATSTKWYMSSPDNIKELVFASIDKQVPIENRRMRLRTPKNY